jgi:hypothetical protein
MRSRLCRNAHSSAAITTMAIVTMHRPLLELVPGNAYPASLQALLVAFSAVAQPATFDEAIESRFRASVVPSPHMIESARTRPTAVWVDTLTDLGGVLQLDRVGAVLSTSDEVTRAAGRKGVLVPAELHPFPDVRPVPPVVRSRLRRARGLPHDAVAVCDDLNDRFSWCDRELDPSLADTALACAAAVVARGSHLLRAMAWGAPIVTDEISNRAVGALPERHLLVEDADPLGVAAQLAHDAVRAALLGRSARRFYEERFDMRRSVHRLAARLCLSAPPPERVRLALEALGTPMNAPRVARAYDRLHPLTR